MPQRHPDTQGEALRCYLTFIRKDFLEIPEAQIFLMEGLTVKVEELGFASSSDQLSHCAVETSRLLLTAGRWEGRGHRTDLGLGSMERFSCSNQLRPRGVSPSTVPCLERSGLRGGYGSTLASTPPMTAAGGRLILKPEQQGPFG